MNLCINFPKKEHPYFVLCSNKSYFVCKKQKWRNHMEVQQKLYPIGIQTFSELIRKNYFINGILF
ncbi:hypothetical protein HMPREF9446_02461 [Bacteroides fluxus YIT 12057]|uniref:Uncharacterized protein n=1 Tax=Bacteroides fluxus YIT 12057 TaxID=763034 RepID=F3PUI8_9BACE|nr:hypothetical protein HMPREF9446_02461 [Bacteroides fluxus YIT 12057]